MTATVLLRKKKPSHVAQAETPKPRNRVSEFEAEPARLRAGRDDETVGQVARAAVERDGERTGRQVDRGHDIGNDLDADMACLLGHPDHQVGA